MFSQSSLIELPVSHQCMKTEPLRNVTAATAASHATPVRRSDAACMNNARPCIHSTLWDTYGRCVGCRFNHGGSPWLRRSCKVIESLDEFLVSTRSINLRIWSEVDVTLFPLLGTTQHLLELDCMSDVAESEGNGSQLSRRLVVSRSCYGCFDPVNTYAVDIDAIDDLLNLALLPTGSFMKESHGPALVDPDGSYTTRESFLDVFTENTADRIDFFAQLCHDDVLTSIGRLRLVGDTIVGRFIELVCILCMEERRKAS